jgi:hypothetical protein
MEQEGSLPCPQEPTAGPYPEPDESNKFPYYTYISELVSYHCLTLHVFPSKLRDHLRVKGLIYWGFKWCRTVLNIRYYYYTYIYTSCSHHSFHALASAVSVKPAASEKHHIITLTSRYQSHKTKPYIWFPAQNIPGRSDSLLPCFSKNITSYVKWNIT